MAIRFDEIQLTGTGAHNKFPTLTNAGSQTLNIQTAHGYLRLGADNTSYAHITTDRPAFYFNKNIAFDGNLTAYGGTETISNFASISASTFTDKDDTSYYVNPNAGSNLAAPITVTTNDTTLTFQDAGTNAFQIKTSAGDELYLGSNNNYQLQMTTAGNVNTQGDWVYPGLVNLGPGSHLGLGDITHPKIVYPGKEASWDGSGNTTGQIIIMLPGNLHQYDMMFMEIDIYEYSGDNASKIILGGHNWNSGGNSNTGTTMWHNYGINIIGSYSKSVYVGWHNDGSDNRRVIVLGEHNTSWSYGTVHVAKVHGACYYTDSIDYQGDWKVEQNATSGSYTRTSSNMNSAGSPTLETNGSVRAPIFYDSNNSGYYLDPNSTGISLNVAGRIQTSSTGVAAAPSLEINCPTSSSFIHTAEVLTANMTAGQANILVIGKVGSTKNAGYIGYNYAAAGSNNNYITIGQWGENHIFRVYGDQVLSKVTLRSESDVRGTIFYDYNNTGYFLDPASNSNLNTINGFGFSQTGGAGKILVTNSSNGYLYLNNWMHVATSGIFSSTNGAHFYPNTVSDYGAWRMSGTRNNWGGITFHSGEVTLMASTSTMGFYNDTNNEWMVEAAINSYVRFYYDGTEQARTDNGFFLANNQLRSPIFYDNNNTNYYLDPNGTSTSLSTTGKWFMQGGHSDARIQLNYAHGSDVANSGALTAWVSEPGITYNGAGIGGNIHVNGQYYGRAYNTGYGAYVRFDKGNGNVEHWSTTGTSGTSGGQGTRQWYNDNGGNSFATTSSRAPIFYDSNDTGFYLNPAVQSRLGSLKLDGIISGTISGCAEYGRNHAYHTPEIKGYGAEFMIGAQHTEININYRTCNNGAAGHTPTLWKWRAGASNNWSDHNFGAVTSNGILTSTASARAPIFYDTNDTSFYVDPHSTSILQILKIGDSSQGVLTKGNVDRNLRYTGATSTDAGFTGYASNGSHLWQLYGAGSDYGFLNANWASWDLRKTKNGNLYMNNNNSYYLNTSSISIFNDTRSNIYYDRQNTAYYIDPASTSKTSINIIDGRLTIGQSSDAGSTYRLYTAGGGQVYFGGHMNASSATFSGAIDTGSNFANLGNIHVDGLGVSPVGTGYGSNKLLGYNQVNGSGRATATLGMNNLGVVMEYEKIMTFKISGNGWVNRSSNPYKLIQAPGADKMIVVDEFLVYIDYATRTGLGSSGISVFSGTAYSVGFYYNETGQSISTANHGISGTFYTSGIMPAGFMNATVDRGYYRDVPVHQSALIANRSLFFRTQRNCSSSGNAPGGAHYIKIKYRIVDISEEFNAVGCNQTIDVSTYHGQYAHNADGKKQYNDAGQATF